MSARVSARVSVLAHDEVLALVALAVALVALAVALVALAVALALAVTLAALSLVQAVQFQVQLQLHLQVLARADPFVETYFQRQGGPYLWRRRPHGWCRI